MKLGDIVSQFEVIKSVEYLGSGSVDIMSVDILGLNHNSREVCRGDLFFALSGNKVDGHKYVSDAIERGAVAVVVERLVENCSVPQVLVEDTRAAMSVFAAKFYGDAYKQLRLVAVTGTNGKTTVSHIISNILEANGDSVAIVGTLGVIVRGKKLDVDYGLTTPDPIQLHKLFARLVQLGIQFVVMEVSAHALYLNKVQGLRFECSVFTNFSRDHLDFFNTMQNYKKAKLKLFDNTYTGTAIVNIDDDFGLELSRNSDLNMITYGCDRPSDVFGINLKMSSDGLQYMLNCVDNLVDINFAIPGRFSMYNTMAAASCAYVLKVPIKKIAIGIQNTTKVEGRFDIIKSDKYTVVIDYAHTDDGLSNVLNTIKQFAKKRIITVFGCGGNRDATKRPLMGLIAAKYSDYVIVTSDNPRYENPDSIINQIVMGIKSQNGTNYECCTQRDQAIIRSLEIAEKDDIILIAGKGAENTQEINGKFLPHNDWTFVQKSIHNSQFTIHN